MIDTDKMRAAYSATPLCQGEWTKQSAGNAPTMLCAISAMVSFAGVQPDLIHTMVEALGAERWFQHFASPVLEAEYGMPQSVAAFVPALFDKQENEWRGVQAVLDLCERHNMDKRHEQAIDEDYERFPQHGPAASDHIGLRNVRYGWNMLTLSDVVLSNFTLAAEPIPVTHLAEKPKGQTFTGKSKFWTAAKTPSVPKLLTV